MTRPSGAQGRSSQQGAEHRRPKTRRGRGALHGKDAPLKHSPVSRQTCTGSRAVSRRKPRSRSLVRPSSSSHLRLDRSSGDTTPIAWGKINTEVSVYLKTLKIFSACSLLQLRVQGSGYLHGQQIPQERSPGRGCRGLSDKDLGIRTEQCASQNQPHREALPVSSRRTGAPVGPPESLTAPSEEGCRAPNKCGERVHFPRGSILRFPGGSGAPEQATSPVCAKWCSRRGSHSDSRTGRGVVKPETPLGIKTNR